MLVGVLVQAAPVRGEGVDVRLGHAVADAPRERDLLVFAQVEIVPSPHLLQEDAELGIRLGSAGDRCLVGPVAHSSSPESGTTRFTSAGPISSSGSVMSTHPVARAACGMPAWAALAGSWIRVVPPLLLMARIPVAPSTPDPDRMTPMARSP